MKKEIILNIEVHLLQKVLHFINLLKSNNDFSLMTKLPINLFQKYFLINIYLLMFFLLQVILLITN